MIETLSFDITTLREGYAAGSLTPEAVVREALRRCDRHRDRNAWITLRDEASLIADVRALAVRDRSTLPLYGIPFAIKDNIDLAGVPTTAGCVEFAYSPAESAAVVAALIAAGAIPIGKTNLDQFATGLNGTRAPEAFGVCRNSFDPAYISGGSSSGSAVATALGMVSFALGTDTAGSGRVPAAFNHLVGLKPTRGVLSTRGVVPACRTLDCVSIFALNCADAAMVFDVAARFDAADPYARPYAPAACPTGGWRIGVPRSEDLQFFGDTEAEVQFAAAICAIEALGAHIERIDISPLLEAARLLYEGPWVAERYAAIRSFIETQPGALHPVVRAIIEPAIGRNAVDAFVAQYRLADLKRRADALMQDIDALLLPTAPTIYTVEQMLADPIRLNSLLGTYTNFVNLLDMSALAVPTGMTRHGMPYGVTLCAPAFHDHALLTIAHRLEQSLRQPLGAIRTPYRDIALPTAAADDGIDIVVCGAHMSGLPLNGQLTSLGATLSAKTTTAPQYRLHALTAFDPPRPGLVRDESQGRAIDVEVWRLPATQLGAFFRNIPSPLALGRVELADGRRECGFLCEAFAVAAAPDVSHFGGWRGYLASRRNV